jgi:hypothetical protein
MDLFLLSDISLADDKSWEFCIFISETCQGILSYFYSPSRFGVGNHCFAQVKTPFWKLPNPARGILRRWV